MHEAFIQFVNTHPVKFSFTVFIVVSFMAILAYVLEGENYHDGRHDDDTE